MRRLLNSPLPSAVLLVNRKRAVRAATTSYCAMLYEISYELLHARAERAEQHWRLKANFERDAAMIQRRIPLPIVDGKHDIASPLETQ